MSRRKLPWYEQAVGGAAGVVQTKIAAERAYLLLVMLAILQLVMTIRCRKETKVMRELT